MQYFDGRKWPRPVLAALALSTILAALYWNWGALAAIGLAPLILAFAPCALMCLVGHCARENNSATNPSETTN